MSYASSTSVPVERSRAELEKLLRAAGSTSLMVGNDGSRIVVGFMLDARTVRLTLAVPTGEELAAKRTRAVTRRWNSRSRSYDSPATRLVKLRDDEERRLWRVLVLVVKAKLEAIAQGLSDVEHEFLADVVVKGGRTIGELLRGEIDKIYKGSDVPRLLLGA